MTDLDKQLLSPQDEECAKHYRDISFEGAETASRRGGELSDEFTRLEVQIATILIGFASLFSNSFSKTSIGFSSGIIIFVLRLTFASSVFFLILSLILGLLHIKRKEQFWEGALHFRVARHRNWLKTLKNESSFKEGMAYHDGTNSDKPLVVASPKWTWVLQTICLGIAVVQLFALFVLFLFK